MPGKRKSARNRRRGHGHGRHHHRDRENNSEQQHDVSDTELQEELEPQNQEDTITITEHEENDAAENDTVRSQAVVKFQTVDLPSYNQLKCNTNLNMPPSNWLSNEANVYGLQGNLFQSAGFSSFHMAHMFPDCVGGVDVVSDAENIKRLLKLPYSPKSTISMMIHRVENTLLIDEFDIHKYLLRQADQDWEWLKSFIYDHILNTFTAKDLNYMLKQRTQTALHQKNLLSKFLHYSLKENNGEDSSTTYIGGRNRKKTQTQKVEKKTEEIQKVSNIQPIQKVDPELPEPNIEENLPDPNSSSHTYNRNVIWQFQDIQMLLGTDMPIFGSAERPYISLRLHDATKPIKVLTGIDYWLDNLMSNVPEVLMCYHEEGFVKEYDVFRTEDLPSLPGSEFDPQIITNIAQYILSFLRANATKAGHTYWLFKPGGDNIIKLYDLTSICNESDDAEDHENPFCVPVGMLLYSVAKNMTTFHANKLTSRHAGSIKKLLQNCLKLLPHERYPRIVAASHFIMADLHLSALPYTEKDSAFPIENDDPVLEDDHLPHIPSTLRLDYNKVAFSAEYKGLKSREYPPPLTEPYETRRDIALEHIASGLESLELESKQLSEERKKRPRSRRNRNKKAIPLPYNQDDKPRAGESKEDFNLRVAEMWNQQIKLLLLEKAAVIYTPLGQKAYTEKHFGKALQYYYIALRAILVIKQCISTVDSKWDELFSQTADAYFQIYQHFSEVGVYENTFFEMNDTNKRIANFLDLKLPEDSKLPFFYSSKLICLLNSNILYEKAFKTASSTTKNQLYCRMGNVLNEIGAIYMKDCQSKEQYFDALRVAEEAFNCLLTSYDYFRTINDLNNMCILKTNLGRFYRVKASVYLQHKLNAEAVQAIPTDTRRRVVYCRSLFLIKTLFQRSNDCYNCVFELLGNRNTSPVLWDIATWEMLMSVQNMIMIYEEASTLYYGKHFYEQLEVQKLYLRCITIANTIVEEDKKLGAEYIIAVMTKKLGIMFLHQSYFHLNNGQKEQFLKKNRLGRKKLGNAFALFYKLHKFKDLIDCMLKFVHELNNSSCIASNRTSSTIVLFQFGLLITIPQYMLLMKEEHLENDSYDAVSFINVVIEFISLLDSCATIFEHVVNINAEAFSEDDQHCKEAVGFYAKMVNDFRQNVLDTMINPLEQEETDSRIQSDKTEDLKKLLNGFKEMSEEIVKYGENNTLFKTDPSIPSTDFELFPYIINNDGELDVDITMPTKS